jgi:CheY-like chemotaxis protein
MRSLVPTRSAATPQARVVGGARVNAMHCLVVDDQPATLDRLARMLRSHPTVGRVSTAASAARALETARAATVDVAFVEVRMPT